MPETDIISLFLYFFCDDCRYDNRDDIPRCIIQRKIFLEDKKIKKLECKRMVKMWKDKSK